MYVIIIYLSLTGLCMYEIKVIYEYMLCLLKFRPVIFFKYPLETIYVTGQRVSKISHVT